MMPNPKRKTSWLAVLILIAAIALWLRDQTQEGRNYPPREKPAAASSSTKVEKNPQPTPAPPTNSGKPERSGNYEVYRNCTLAPHHSNDGDSFLIRLPDGREAIFRLYYVDTPESEFRRYKGGETNHERIRQQAAEMGGITPQQAVETGKKSKLLTLGLLEKSPFTLYTAWDSPFNDQRYHAFIQIKDQGQSKWLDEILIEHGLARIKTKPAPLPDGTPVEKHLAHLRDLQATARKTSVGVWSY